MIVIINLDTPKCIFDPFIIDVDQVRDPSLVEEFLMSQHGDESKNHRQGHNVDTQKYCCQVSIACG